MPLHTCECPPCFEQKGSGSSATCSPKCSLDGCDLATGVCAPGSGASGAGARTGRRCVVARTSGCWCRAGVQPAGMLRRTDLGFPRRAPSAGPLFAVVDCRHDCAPAAFWVARALADFKSRLRAGGSQLLSVLLTVALVCGVLGAVGYGVYQFRIRSAMHQEIRAIMRQYMPLQVRPCHRACLCPSGSAYDCDHFCTATRSASHIQRAAVLTHP